MDRVAVWWCLVAVFLMTTCSWATSDPPEINIDIYTSAVRTEEPGEANNATSTQLPSLGPATEEATNMQYEMVEEARKAGHKKGGMEKMYMMFMMCKTLFSTVMMAISPIIEVKKFGLSIIDTLIRLGQFLMQLKNLTDKKEEVWQKDVGHLGHHAEWADERLATNQLHDGYNPNYIHKYYVKL